MDTFENNEFPVEPEVTQPEPEQVSAEEVWQEDAIYHGAGIGRKESLFDGIPAPDPEPDPQPMEEPVRNDHFEPRYEPQRHAYEKPKKPKKAKGKHRSIWRGVLAAVLVLTLVGGSCALTASMVNDRWEEKTEQMTAFFNQPLAQIQEQINSASKSDGTVSSVIMSGDALTPSQVYAKNVNAVVLITCQVTTSYYGQSTTGTSAGSGFIITENGYVVTNYHVVEGASKITVTTYEDGDFQATLVGSDETNDVAVLKVEASGLPYVTIGSSDDLVVGDQVVAIGNPLGELTSTMTVGYVSAKDRDVTTDDTIINMIQTDVAINSGNSGGPLFNMKGEVIGITTAKYSGSSSSGATIEGIGFAIPISDVSSMISDLMNYGYVTGAYMGVGVRDVDATAQTYGVPAGAYVVELYEGYAAVKAGVQVGDIITAVDSYEIDTYTDLSRALRNYKAGDTAILTVYRSGQTLQLTITFDEKPQSDNMPSGSYEEWYKYFFGQGQGNGSAGGNNGG